MNSRRIEVRTRGRTVQSGLIAEIAAAISSAPPGDVVEFIGTDPSDAPEMERWSRVTGHAIVGRRGVAGDGETIRIRKTSGTVAPLAVPTPASTERRLWLYFNFDCNLSCDYCCVRSSPRAARRALDLDTVSVLAREAQALTFDRVYVTGGEPFLLPDIGAKVAACAEHLPTTVLTNAMLFEGPRRAALESLPRDRVTFQVSIDSPTAERHDAHRGMGSWKKARNGVRIARDLGFRVRVAATVHDAEERESMVRFLADEGVPEEDRVIRPVALRGAADIGVAFARAELEPEPTVTAGGLYWHPVGADDDDFLVTEKFLPLAQGLQSIERKRAEDREFGASVASVFNCA